MNNSIGKHHEQKARTTISLEPWLLQYAAEVGRGNISLGFRHAIIEYRDKLDLEVRATQVSSHAGTDCKGTEG